MAHSQLTQVGPSLDHAPRVVPAQRHPWDVQASRRALDRQLSRANYAGSWTWRRAALRVTREVVVPPVKAAGAVLLVGAWLVTLGWTLAWGLTGAGAADLSAALALVLQLTGAAFVAGGVWGAYRGALALSDESRLRR